MALKNRIYGHSLSSIERELIFSREDTGFVRAIHASGNIFYLDPSPFLKTPRREVYVAHCPPPAQGDLIQASVSSVDTDIMKDRAGYYSLAVKHVESWTPIDPNSLPRRKNVLSQEEIRGYFSMPYRGEEKVVDEIALCSALYAVSSPPLGDEKGGVFAAILGKAKPWSGFKRSMGIIPGEFRKTTSPYYYHIAPHEDTVRSVNAYEVNLAYLNPERLPMHIPVVLDDVEVRASKSYTQDLQSLNPMVTAFILDSLMIRPEIPAGLDSYVTDTMYSVIEDFKGAGYVPYQQNFDSLVPRLSLAFARFHSHLTLSKKDVTAAVDVWSDMFYRAKRVVTDQYEVSRLYRLDDASRRLYLDLVASFELEQAIPLSDVREQITYFKTPESFDEALSILNQQGLLLKPGPGTIKILDNRSVKA